MAHAGQVTSVQWNDARPVDPRYEDAALRRADLRTAMASKEGTYTTRSVASQWVAGRRAPASDGKINSVNPP
jgi:hypothetical protein